ncbi:AEC family transporter [Desulfospira joergensenii]|uniref:AEC family transporter n=1 Tax=Desulfospira joergensenii TaxID=53329 RepID=UPI0004112592|nr:AEC family transporter [Desulfospira joergensenii]
MLPQLFSIFFNVVCPVFALVLLGYMLGPKLDIQYRSLSRAAYYILIPGFIFNVLSQVRIDFATAGRMIIGIGVVYLATGLLGLLVARMMGYGKEMAVAFLMTCVFGNVGNFGLALTRFRLGDAAMESATIYMVTVNTISFACCILAASWVHRGGFGALKNLTKTPGVVILPLALFFPLTGTIPPVMVQRITGLLADAMIPMMLLILGLQLREAKRLEWGRPAWAACGVRLVIGPALGFLLIPWIGLSGLQASAGILQSAMPAAVLTAIIAMEHDVAPTFVTSVVFAGTLLSLASLTVVMLLL